MTLPIRTAHDGLELPAIGFGTYRVQGLTSSPPSGMPSRTATASAPPRPFRRSRARSRLCPRPFRRDRAKSHPHSLARKQIFSVI